MRKFILAIFLLIFFLPVASIAQTFYTKIWNNNSYNITCGTIAVPANSVRPDTGNTSPCVGGGYSVPVCQPGENGIEITGDSCKGF